MIYWLFQEIAHFSVNVAFVLITLQFFSTVNYVLCFLITSLTIDAMTIGDILYDLNWYQLPRAEQYIVQIIIRRSQDSIEMKGLGVFVCSLETFLKVRIRRRSLGNEHLRTPFLSFMFILLVSPSWSELPWAILWFFGRCAICNTQAGSYYQFVSSLKLQVVQISGKNAAGDGHE